MLIGREEEFARIESLISEAINGKQPLSIYISGTPGTGKTATVQAVMQKLLQTTKKRGQKKKFDFVPINCYASFTAGTLAQEILTKLGPKTAKGGPKLNARNAGQALEEHFEAAKRPIVILLDEVDNLVLVSRRRGNVLEEAFSWPAKHPGRVILIGISNSLNLTACWLQKQKPQAIITFSAYTPAQLVAILEAKRATENFEQTAIELCARKASSLYGDVRRALDYCAHVQQILDSGKEEVVLAAEKENVNVEKGLQTPQKATPKKNDNQPTPTRSALKRPAVDELGQVTPKKAACRDVLNAINKTLSSPAQRVRLPTHQGILLATLMRLLSTGGPPTPGGSVFRTPRKTPNGKGGTPHKDGTANSQSVSRERLLQAYMDACEEKAKVPPLQQEELNEAFEMLQSHGMIKLHGKGGQQQVCFMVEMSMAKLAINNNELWASIVEGDREL